MERAPRREMMPRDGLNPNTPQNEAESTTPPPDSQAIASGTWHAPTAAAALPQGSPALRFASHGLIAAAGGERFGPVARVLPMTTAPASFSRSSTAGIAFPGELPEESGARFAGMPFAPKSSSSATGTPCRAPSGRPR